MVLRAGAAQLVEAGIEGAPRDARRLMAGAMGVASDRLTLCLADEIDESVRTRFADYIARRARREPVSHILGGRLFHGRWFTVSRDVLDPRPETETLVEAALAAPFSRVLDLGTGSGAILITLLADRDEARGVGTDLSEAALGVARDNAHRLNVAGQVEFRCADWFSGIGGRFDLIVSNPPYIAQAEMAGLSPELKFEPHMALSDGGDGLSAYRVIAGEALRYLEPGGRLMVEIGPTQAEAVADLMRAGGFVGVRVVADLDNRDRVVMANAPDFNDS